MTVKAAEQMVRDPLAKYDEQGWRAKESKKNNQHLPIFLSYSAAPRSYRRPRNGRRNTAREEDKSAERPPQA